MHTGVRTRKTIYGELTGTTTGANDQEHTNMVAANSQQTTLECTIIDNHDIDLVPGNDNLIALYYAEQENPSPASVDQISTNYEAGADPES